MMLVLKIFFAVFFVEASSSFAQASPLQCAEIFMSAQERLVNKQLEKEVLSSEDWYQVQQVIADKSLSTENRAELFYQTYSRSEITNYSDFANILVTVNAMTSDVAKLLVHESQDFEGFNTLMSQSDEFSKSVGQAIFLNILTKSPEGLARTFRHHRGYQGILSENYNSANQFAILKKDLKPELLVLTTLNEYMKSIGPLGAYALQLSAENIQKAAPDTKQGMAEAVIKSFDQIFEAYIANKKLSYSQAKTYMEAHALALEGIARPVFIDIFEETPVDLALNRQMIMILETLAKQYPIASNRPSLYLIYHVVSSDPKGAMVGNFHPIKFPYNQVPNITEARILPLSNLYHFRLRIENILQDIRKTEKEKATKHRRKGRGMGALL